MRSFDLGDYHLIFTETSGLVKIPMGNSGRGGKTLDTGFEKQDDAASAIAATNARTQREPLPLGYEPR